MAAAASSIRESLAAALVHDERRRFASGLGVLPAFGSPSERGRAGTLDRRGAGRHRIDGIFTGNVALTEGEDEEVDVVNSDSAMSSKRPPSEGKAANLPPITVSRRPSRRWLGPMPARLVITAASRDPMSLSLNEPLLFVSELALPPFQRDEILRLARQVDEIGLQPVWNLPHKSYPSISSDPVAEPTVVCDERGREQCVVASAMKGAFDLPVGVAAPCGMPLLENRLFLPLSLPGATDDTLSRDPTQQAVPMWSRDAFRDACLISPSVWALAEGIRALMGMGAASSGTLPVALRARAIRRTPTPTRLGVLPASVLHPHIKGMLQFTTRPPDGMPADSAMLGSLKNVVPFLVSILPEAAMFEMRSAAAGAAAGAGRAEEERGAASEGALPTRLHWSMQFLAIYSVTANFNMWLRFRPYRDTTSGKIVTPDFLRDIGYTASSNIGSLLSHGATLLHHLVAGKSMDDLAPTGPEAEAVRRECDQFVPAATFFQRSAVLGKRMTAAMEASMRASLKDDIPPEAYVEYMTHLWQRIAHAMALWVNRTRVRMHETLYRGVRTIPGYYGVPDLGTIFEEEGFLSFTNELSVAVHFAALGDRFDDSETMVLEFPNAVVRCFIKPAENEYVMPPGTRWRVVRDDGVVDGRRRLICEFVEPHAWATTTAGAHHFFVPDTLRETLPALRARFPLIEAYVEWMARESGNVTPAHRLVETWAADSGHYVFRGILSEQRFASERSEGGRFASERSEGGQESLADGAPRRLLDTWPEGDYGSLGTPKEFERAVSIATDTYGETAAERLAFVRRSLEAGWFEGREEASPERIFGERSFANGQLYPAIAFWPRWGAMQTPSGAMASSLHVLSRASIPDCVRAIRLKQQTLVPSRARMVQTYFPATAASMRTFTAAKTYSKRRRDEDMNPQVTQYFPRMG
jgi:hypothetical protein